MEPAAIHRETRLRMLELGRSLDPEAAATRCAATPEWTVKDVYAHLAGVAADSLAGRLEGVATDPWTARQVAERAARGLPEVLDEWEEAGPSLEALIAELGDALDPRLLIDQWTHEQDVRQALGLPALRDTSAAAFALDPLVAAFSRSVHVAKLPTVELKLGDTAARQAGKGEPAGRLEVDAFDFMRGSLGRRSPAQMRAWAWSVDPEPYLRVLPVFGPRDTDLVEP